jgi:aminopeptidase-like protein
MCEKSDQGFSKFHLACLREKEIDVNKNEQTQYGEPCAENRYDAEIKEMDELFDRLFPICRSITGPGLRETITVLSEYLPLESFSVATGEQVYDWQIPKEWTIREGWLKGPDGEIIADFRKSNLQIVNYSIPVDKKLTLAELKGYLFSIPHLPDAIPYVTSYYKERWGFCIPHSTLKKLSEGEYHAYIDSELSDGELNYAHAILPGETEQEVLISTYICHPSLANNELSGPLVAAYLYNRLSKWKKRRYTYRFVFVPETIGSISYLHRFGSQLREKVKAGLVLTCMGGKDQSLSYKLSRSGANPIDKLWGHLTRYETIKGGIRPFTPAYGSDERQYCSPGFNLPVGQIARAVYGTYPGYHNSYDTKESMTIEALKQSVDEMEILLTALEADGYYVNQSPYGEVKLDKHGLYPDINSPVTGSRSSNDVVDNRTQLNRILTILNYADGEHTLMQIADLCGCSLVNLLDLLKILLNKGILTGPFPDERRLSL